MPKKSMVILTESMFYVLMALTQCQMCGIEINEYVNKKTNGRVFLGPATLYTILGKFENEKYIKEVCVDGRKRTYSITQKGIAAYRQEVDRLKMCISDAQNSEVDEVI